MSHILNSQFLLNNIQPSRAVTVKYFESQKVLVDLPKILSEFFVLLSLLLQQEVVVQIKLLQFLQLDFDACNVSLQLNFRHNRILELHLESLRVCIDVLDLVPNLISIINS